MSEILIPGGGFANLAGAGQRLVPGVGLMDDATLTGSGILSGGGTLDDFTASGTVSGGAPTTLSSGGTFDDFTATGTISIATCVLSGAPVLDDFTASGTIAPYLGSIVTPPLKNNTGTVLASVTGVIANVYDIATGALVLRKTGLSSNGSGVVTITDQNLLAGTTYAYEIDLSVASLGRRLPTGIAA